MTDGEDSGLCKFLKRTLDCSKRLFAPTVSSKFGEYWRLTRGRGTFIGAQKQQRDDAERQRRLNQLAGEFAARAGSSGFTLEEVLEALHDMQRESGKKRR